MNRCSTPSDHFGSRVLWTVVVLIFASPQEISTKGSELPFPVRALSLAGSPLASRTSISRIPMGKGDLTLTSSSSGMSFLVLTSRRCGRTNVSAITVRTVFFMIGMISLSRRPPPKPEIFKHRTGGSLKKNCRAPKQGSLSTSGASTTEVVPVRWNPLMATSRMSRGIPAGPVPFIFGFAMKSWVSQSMSRSICSPWNSCCVFSYVRSLLMVGGTLPGSYSMEISLTFSSGCLESSVCSFSIISFFALCLIASRAYFHMTLLM
mmetsp:Transcript_39952/g.105699  ORF Transcript_39952/g.105699 Transcript_39952/m.105699 type:complete len:263 (+) Transcript_39952:1529-2317(+)